MRYRQSSLPALRFDLYLRAASEEDLIWPLTAACAATAKIHSSSAVPSLLICQLFMQPLNWEMSQAGCTAAVYRKHLKDSSAIEPGKLGSLPMPVNRADQSFYTPEQNDCLPC